MFTALIIGVVVLAALHVASYGWYALREENNLRGAVGAFLTAGATFLAPILLLVFYEYFLV